MKLVPSVVFTSASLAAAFTPSAFMGSRTAKAPKSGSALEMKYKVAVVGGGPSGACAAEIFAQEKGIDTYLFERKMDNAKPCGGAIPLCMIGEFDIPESVVDRKVSYAFSGNLQQDNMPYLLGARSLFLSHQPCLFCPNSFSLFRFAR